MYVFAILTLTIFDMKKFILFVILVFGFTACSALPESAEEEAVEEEAVEEEAVEEEAVEEEEVEAEGVTASLILEAFEVKYSDRDYDGFIVDINKGSDDYAMGVISPAGDGPGGWWYAAKVDGAWMIIQDGNGDPACEVLEEYGVPAEWYTYDGVKGCF